MLERHLARTKILATLGPASGSLTRIRELVRAGADGFRLNLSHGDRETRTRWVRMNQAVRKELDRPVTILADLRGPRLRLGRLAAPCRLKRGEEVRLRAGRTAPEGVLPVDYRGLLRDLEVGHRVLLRDGRVELVVREQDGRELVCRVKRGDTVDSNQGVNLPDSVVTAPVLSAKDKEDLKWAAEAGVDWIALSFVRQAADLAVLRRAMARIGFDAPVMAKVETPEALKNLEEIVQASNAVMVARGDLAVELGHERVPIIQKDIIATCLQYAIPVVTATQMLESMIESTQPTRAEVSDVANAVIDRTDVLMLSGETAVGVDPVQVVRTMNRIALKAEESLYKGAKRDPGTGLQKIAGSVSVIEAATVSAAVAAARQSEARGILAFTESGRTARLASSFRSGRPLIGLTANECSFHRMALYWGVRPALIPRFKTVRQMHRNAAATLKRAHWLREQDLLVALTGAFSRTGATNTVRLLHLDQLGRVNQRPAES
jgi:pyruvate kinase